MTPSERHLASAPLFQPQAALLALGTVKHFTPDQPIYREGDPAGHFMQVAAGVVRSASLMRDGRRYIDAFHVRGDVFGLEGNTHHARSAEAVCACSAVFYPARDLSFPKDSQPRPFFTALMLDLMMRGLRQAQDHARLLGRASAMEKTCAFLIEWASRAEDWPLLTLAMNRQDIADYLGLTVETVSRCLAQLHRDRLIDILSARRLRLLNVPALQDMLG